METMTTTLVRVCGPRTHGEPEMVEVPLTDAWLIWSHEHDAWWGPAFAGYYVSPLAAGLYTCEAAESECEPHPRFAGRAPEEARRAVDVLTQQAGRTPRHPTLGDAFLAALAPTAPAPEVAR